jgi:hypothetical protein
MVLRFKSCEPSQESLVLERAMESFHQKGSHFEPQTFWVSHFQSRDTIDDHSLGCLEVASPLPTHQPPTKYSQKQLPKVLNVLVTWRGGGEWSTISLLKAAPHHSQQQETNLNS